MEISKRIIEGRKALGYTQAQLAEEMGVKRSLIADIEASRRNVRAGELAALARVLERPVEFFLSEEEPIELATASRAETEKVSLEIRKAELRLRKRLEGCSLLKEVLEDDVLHVQIAEAEIDNAHIIASANRAAKEQRAMFGLGSDPIPDLRSVLEQQVKVPVFGEPLEEDFLGMLLFSEDGTTAVMLVNGSTRTSRRNFTIAHEWGHLIWKVSHQEFTPDTFFKDAADSNEERFANAFAGQIMAPDEGIQEHFDPGEGADLAGHVQELATTFGTSYQAMTYRLQNVGLIEEATAQNLRNDVTIWGCPETQQEWSGFANMSPLYHFLACRAYQQNALDETKCAELLNTTTAVFLDAMHEAATPLAQEEKAFAPD